MRKVTSLFLALLLVLALTPAFAESANLSEPGVLPIWTGDEPYTLTVLIPQRPEVADYKDNDLTRWVEKSCNVNLEFEYLPSDDANQKLAIMINSGDKLPDIICTGNISVSDAYNYGQAGALLDVSDYYKNGLAYYADKAVAQHPDWNLITNITCYDGSIYGVPRIQVSPPNETKYKLWINQTWLDKLGMELPTTTEEFKEMLIRFRDDDPNGNGEKDELPLLGSSSWGGSPVKYLTNAFVHEGDGDMLMLKDGHVTASYIQDGWFEAVDYIKDLVAEDLLLPESFTYGRPDIVAAAADGKNRVGCLFDSSLGFLGSASVETRLQYTCNDPLTGPEGVRTVAYAQSTTTIAWAVTTYCEQPELAFRVGDFMFSEEGFLRGRFGNEGEQWITVEDYLKDHPGAEIKASFETLGYEAKYLFDFPGVNDVLGKVQNVNWFDKSPYYSGDIENQGGYIYKDENGNLVTGYENSGAVRQNLATGVYQSLKPDANTYCPTLNFSAAEIEELGEIRNNLKTFVNQQRTLYVLGQEASFLDDKDAFLAELNNIGLERFLELADVAYQRQYVD